ncbi:transcription initiation factor IIB [Thermococcus sp. P6]|uniref:transcription initiation factor IIB n=1 Tax=Thermococcus sp. P6 TaxID=122420 RepID=UPI000B5A0369|nr:transcription initiation factor IIB [Thermococcus sp. P6]ASJ10161.1 transcription initiation factor IIB [Thermococcus sp. P6]
MADRMVCPRCGSKLIYDRQHGEYYCSSCGYVVRQNIVDNGPEWRAFDPNQRARRARTGAPMTLMIHDKGLSTDIDWRDRDVNGNQIKGMYRMKMRRLRMWQRRMRINDAAERNLAFALSELDRMAAQMMLPRHLKEAAASIYRKAVAKKLIRGRSIEGMVSAALYAACRMERMPRTLDEIAEVSKVKKKEIGRSYRFLVKGLNLNLRPTSPVDYVDRFGDALSVSYRTKKRAKEILQKAIKRGITSGKGPTGLAAAALYVASILEGEKKTQREVAEVAHVTEVTVRNRYKELVERLNINVPV